jgi:Arc/MetJ-type ribon-helix-helix transcriptional regulator
MLTLTVELPEEYRVAVDERVKALALEDEQAYVRRLIREDVNRVAAEQVEKLLREADESGPAVEMSSAELREHLARRLRTREEQKVDNATQPTLRESV